MDENEFRNGPMCATEVIERAREAVMLAAPYPTLRDQFAMAALTGYLAHGRWTVEDGTTFAQLAFQCADEMLEARKK